MVLLRAIWISIVSTIYSQSINCDLCSHACLTHDDGSASCACPSGWKLESSESVDCYKDVAKCGELECSHACFEDDGEAKCACPKGMDFAGLSLLECATPEIPSGKVAQHVTNETFIRSDGRIRDANNDLCVQKRYQHLKEGQPLFLQPCDEAIKGQYWNYDSDTGLISTGDKYEDTYCIVSQLNIRGTGPESGTKVTSGRQVVTKTCDTTDEWQVFDWDFDNAVIRLRNGGGCLYWDEEDGLYIKTMQRCKMMTWGIANQAVTSESGALDA